MLPDLSSLADPDLVARVEGLVATDRQTTAELLAHLAEVEERRLYVASACSSLFSWCVEVLHLSEDAANKRIRAARLVRRFPALYEALVDGRLHMSGIGLLGAQLTEDNQHELIAAASGKSKRQIVQLLADWRPKPDVPTRIRRCPRPSGDTRPADGATQTPAADQGDLFEERAVEERAGDGVSAAPPTSPPQPGSAPRGATDSRERGRIDPLGDQRYKIQFMASAELVANLELAADLLSHRMPNGDLAQVVEEAVTQLCDRLMKQRFGAPRKTKKAAASEKAAASMKAQTPDAPATGPGASRACASSPAPPVVPPAPEKATSRHIPMAARRQVIDRDGHRCTYVDPKTGRRCSETRYLELHHVKEWARHRSHDPELLTLRCRIHNDYAARLDYGEEHMRRCKTEGRPPSQGSGGGTHH